MHIRIKVKTGLRKEEFLQISDTSFEARIREKPERGAANERVLALVAQEFKVPQKNIRILSGHRRPNKTLSITGDVERARCENPAFASPSRGVQKPASRFTR